MNKKRYILLIGWTTVLYIGLFAASVTVNRQNSERVLVTDVSRLQPVFVRKIVVHEQVNALQEAIREAREKNLKVSIAGRRHSQGGHTFYDDAVVLDMSEFDEVLALDVENKMITVQSGATWEDVQNYINPHRLSVKTMQSSYIFTVGGTLSANAHGRDLGQTTVIESVRAFRLLLADGRIVNVSRTENPELFGLVIGGYGLFGVILDVDIQLTDDEVLEKKSVTVSYRDFPDYFDVHLKDNPDVGLFIGRPSIAPSTLLDEIAVVTWNKTDKTQEGIFDLTEEEHVMRDKFVFGLSRYSVWGKELRWRLQKRLVEGAEKETLVSRNNAMRPPVAPIDFLDHHSTRDNDVIQEYYIPPRNFVAFVEGLKKILIEEDVNAISFTIRYVAPNSESYLSYAPNEEAFSIVVMFNQKLSRQGRSDAQRTTRRIVDEALKNEGNYYLTYQLYPKQEQLRQAYPSVDFVFERKRFYDPQELFMNKFYEKYALGKESDELAY